MKRITCLMAFAIALLSFGPGAALATQGHFTPGASGIMGATLPPPGTYWKIYNVFVDPGGVRNDSGKKIGTADLDVFSLTARFINTFDAELLGGNPILDISVPMNYTQSGTDEHFSLGDSLVQGLLAWHGERWDAVIGPGIYLPIGNQRDIGAGKDYYSWMFGGGMTHYFLEDKSLSFSWIARIEGHFENNADRTPGYAVHGEFGLGKLFAPNVNIGVAATAYQQISDDKGEQGASPFAKDDLYRGFAAGPEVQFYTQSGLVVELRYFWQFAVRNGTQGRTFFLNLTKAF